MQREEKKEVIADLNQQFSSVQGAVLTNYQGLSVTSITEIRRAFRAEGVTFKVVKNTLARLAIKGTPLDALSEDFSGPIAIAYSEEDPIAPARIAEKCAEKEEKFEILCGLVDSSRLNEDGVFQLAKLPSKEELQSKLLNVMNAPGTQFVRTLNAVPQKVAFLLSALQSKLEEEGKESISS